MSLENEIALVTGASRGIGQAITLELGRMGATVIGTEIFPEGVAEIEKTFAAQGVKGGAELLDVTDQESVDRLMDTIAEKYGAATILVNNAGITRDNLLMRMKQADWDAVIATNLTSVYRMSKACLRPMVKARKGRIVSIASVVGVTGNAGQTNYSAAKAGLMGFSKSLAREVAPRGVTVNAVAPGFIDTAMTKGLPEEQKTALLKQIPLGRLGSPTEIAQAVAFLCSPSAAYITGETLHVNGGMHMA